MRRKSCSFFAVCFSAQLAILLSGSLSAGTLYSDGTVNGNEDAWTINNGYQVADSFSLAATSTLQSVTFDVWLENEFDVGETVDWSIVGDPTMQASTLYASGTGAALVDAPVPGLQPNDEGLFVHSETFSLPNVDLGPGVYYLTLENFTAVNSSTSSIDDGPVLWDEDDGPSVAWQNAVGYLVPSTANGCNVTSGYCSETFEIDGTSTAATPEPDSIALAVAGFAMLAASRLRKTERCRSFAQIVLRFRATER
jgi:hypothetical protein